MNFGFGLFRKYALVILALVGGTLLVGGIYEMIFNYRERLEATAAVQRSEAGAAAVRIEQFLMGIQAQISQVSGLPWASGLLGDRDRLEEYRRLLKLVPSIAEIRSVDATGRQRIKASRVDPDEVAANADETANPRVLEAREKGVSFSPTYFKDGLEPYLTLAIRDGGAGPSVALVELNLKFVGDVVSRMRIGKAGKIYVVDDANKLVAHSNVGHVVRKVDLSGYAPLGKLRMESDGGRVPVVGMVEAIGLDGDDVMISAARIPSANWLVVVEQPQAEVLEPVYDTVTRTAIFIVLGLALALAVSYFLARRLARPILQVREGASRIAQGDLTARIDVKTGDEVQALAEAFNHMADQLQDYTANLERKVTEKTAELELANRHKSEFLANMSHELRTPLNAVIGFSDALKEQMFGDLNPKQMEYVRDILASGQHLLSLINDILDLSKIEAGRMDLDTHVFDVRAALDNCAILIRERAQRRGLKFELDVPGDLGCWEADERRMKQVLINLLSNAVKFTSPGGEVRLAARRLPEALELSVSDTGPGIAIADRERIFEEFSQLPAGGESNREGTGLGLSLSRRLVELHGGTIAVVSEPGRGSTFIARFPRLSRHASHG